MLSASHAVWNNLAASLHEHDRVHAGVGHRICPRGVPWRAHRTWRRGRHRAPARSGLQRGYPLRHWGVARFGDRNLIGIGCRVCAGGILEHPRRYASRDRHHPRCPVGCHARDTSARQWAGNRVRARAHVLRVPDSAPTGVAARRRRTRSLGGSAAAGLHLSHPRRSTRLPRSASAAGLRAHVCRGHSLGPPGHSRSPRPPATS
jgi:hypothetical protein